MGMAVDILVVLVELHTMSQTRKMVVVLPVQMVVVTVDFIMVEGLALVMVSLYMFHLLDQQH